MATNSQVDTAAAAVPAPAGPLTRVTDLDAMNISYNQDISLQFTTDGSAPALGAVYTVYLTYNELVDADLVIKRLKEQIGIPYTMYDFIDRLDTINTAAQALTPPYTDTMWKTLWWDLLQDLPELKAF